MRVVVIGLACAVGLYLIYEGMRIAPLYRAAERQVEMAQPYTRAGSSPGILVLGDSTAVGVGATKPEETVAGRLARHLPQLAVENHAVSGARIHDMDGQFKRASKDRYRLIIMHVGANDLIRLRTAENAATALEPMLVRLRARADRVVFLCAGNVGAAGFFPWPMRGNYQRLNLEYHERFTRLGAATSTQYVNLFTPPATDPFVLQASVFMSIDQLHPSSEGYRLWFERIVPHL